MKFEEPGTDRTAEILFRADGTICTEYDCPRDEKDNAYRCFVSVTAGQSISIDCTFRGTTNQVNFDLSVDGILRNSHVITTRAWRPAKRAVKFNSGFYVDESGDITEAEFRVLNLDTTNNIIRRSAGRETVGMVEVRLSVPRSFNEISHDLGDLPHFKDSRGWRLDFDRPSWLFIKPTHEITFFRKDQQPLQNSISRLLKRSKSDATRPGTETWLTVRFFYRSLLSIRNLELQRSNLRAPPHQLLLGDVVEHSNSLANVSGAVDNEAAKSNAGKHAASSGAFVAESARAGEVDNPPDPTDPEFSHQPQLEQRHTSNHLTQSTHQTAEKRRLPSSTVAAPQQDSSMADLNPPIDHDQEDSTVRPIELPIRPDTGDAMVEAPDQNEPRDVSSKGSSAGDNRIDKGDGQEEDDQDMTISLSEAEQGAPDSKDDTEVAEPDTTEKKAMPKPRKTQAKKASGKKQPAKSASNKEEQVEKDASDTEPVKPASADTDASPKKKVAEKKPRGPRRKKLAKADEESSQSGKPAPPASSRKAAAASGPASTKKAPSTGSSITGRKKRSAPASTTPEYTPKRLKQEIAEKEALLAKRKDELVKKQEARHEYERLAQLKQELEKLDQEHELEDEKMMQMETDA